MNKYKLQKLKQDILACKKRLFEIEPYIKENAAMATMYNQILVQKAVLIDDYKKECAKTNVILGTFKKAFAYKKEKLICDYFYKA